VALPAEHQKQGGLIVIRLYALSLLAVATASAADLTVTIKAARNSNGVVLMSVYDSGEKFMKPPLAKYSGKAEPKDGQVQFVFHNVPAGRYAVASFHDENANGKLDTNTFGMPVEGVAFSNDAPVTFGPPAFAEAAFDFDGKADKSIALSLKY
jgi:uncharacterized protein (DUF2141 family)